MKTLHNLIQTLSPLQKNMISEQLSYGSNKVLGKTQTIKLYDLLKKDITDNISEKEYSQRIFGKINLPKLYTIKSRLKNRILEILISEQNLSTHLNLDELDNVSINLRKRLLQMRTIYWGHGNLKIINELLAEIISTSKEYELYDILNDALQFKKGQIGLRQGNEVYDNLIKDIDIVQECLSAVYRCNQLYNQYLINKRFKTSISFNENLTLLKSYINELSDLYNRTGSINVQYHLNIFKIEYLELENDLQNSRIKVIEQLNLVKSNKSIFRKTRIGFCYSNLSSVDIFLKEYKTAYKNSMTAQSFMPINSFNYIICESTKFYASFYNRDVLNAESSLIILRSHMKEDQGEFNGAMYEYFQANLHFIKSEFGAALKIVGQNLEISKDKSGWDIATRILAIMCMIELRFEDQASNAVEALRKHIQRVTKTSPLNERDVIIFKVMQQLEKKGFALSNLHADEIAGLRTLEIENTLTSWQPFTPELIPFNEWLAGKLCQVKIRNGLVNKQN